MKLMLGDGKFRRVNIHQSMSEMKLKNPVLSDPALSAHGEKSGVCHPTIIRWMAFRPFKN